MKSTLKEFFFGRNYHNVILPETKKPAQSPSFSQQKEQIGVATRSQLKNTLRQPDPYFAAANRILQTARTTMKPQGKITIQRLGNTLIGATFPISTRPITRAKTAANDSKYTTSTHSFAPASARSNRR